MLVLLSALVVAVSCQYDVNPSSCALIIPHPSGHSEPACISFKDVDEAFGVARERVPLVRGRSSKDNDFPNLADVLVEASGLIAKKHGLGADVVSDGLPLIDTKRTAIDGFCPASFKQVECDPRQPFRTFDGVCNNLQHPQRGAVSAAFRRLLPANYADGISDPRVAVSGRVLPAVRSISTFQHRDLGFHDHAVTIFLPAWGQLIDHDMASGAETKDPQTNEEPKCCDVPEERRHPACWPIDIPAEDPFFSHYRKRCMNFVRSATGLKEHCKLGSRSTFNTVTSILDAGFVYGTDEEKSRKLRVFRGGLLKSNSMHRDKGLKDLLPPNLDEKACKRDGERFDCFLAGDGRVNQQVMLVTLHTLLMREHNRIAEVFGQINPHWDDERIYQETRNIIAAQVQHITYNEFLPMVLGKHQMKKYGLLLKQQGYTTYDPELDTSLPVAFFAAAFRFGHSLLPSTIERWSTSHKFISSKKLSDMLLRPFDMYEAGVADQYMSGFMNQVSQAVDDGVTKELTNHLFKTKQGFGADLASLNMQRGRDHGMPSYNAFREFCGLPRARHWNDLSGAFTNNTLQKYSDIYDSPEDIDLWSAGISERPAPGSMLGPVFACILGETFRNLRGGDRFWYENEGSPNSFTPAQLEEIRRDKLSRIICDNSDHLDTVQVYSMVLPDPEINPRVACKSSILPRINLEMWRESPQHSSGHSRLNSEFNFNQFQSVPRPEFRPFFN